MNELHESPIAWWNRKTNANSIFSGRLKNKAAIVIVEKGSISILIGTHEYIIAAGELFLIPPGYSFKSKTLESVHILVCRFTPDILSSVFNPLRSFVKQEADSDGFVVLKATDMIHHFVNLMDYYISSDTDQDEMRDAKQLEFFLLLSITYPEEELVNFLLPAIDNEASFRGIVTRNWAKARNVGELASAMHMSTSGFIKKFRKYYNDSPYRWMTSQKSSCILKDIFSGEMPLLAIADKYRFSSYAHFCNFCKKHYNDSPSKLKKSNKMG